MACKEWGAGMKVADYVRNNIVNAEFVPDPMIFRLDIPIELDDIVKKRFDHPDDETASVLFDEAVFIAKRELEKETGLIAEKLRSTMQRTDFEIDSMDFIPSDVTFGDNTIAVADGNREKVFKSDEFVDLDNDDQGTMLEFEVKLKTEGLSTI